MSNSGYEAQWLIESPKSQSNRWDKKKEDEEEECCGVLSCRSSSSSSSSTVVTWLLIVGVLVGTALLGTAVVMYYSNHFQQAKTEVQIDTSSSSMSMQKIANQALTTLNTNLIIFPTPNDKDNVDFFEQEQQQQSQSQSQEQEQTHRFDHCEATVLLFRHCDDYGLYAKDDEDSGDKHCSHMGFERANFIPSLFGPIRSSPSSSSAAETKIGSDSYSSSSFRWPKPNFLYALLPEQPRGINYRQIETLLPLAQQQQQQRQQQHEQYPEDMDVPIHVVREPSQVANAIFDTLRTDPDSMCNAVTVVAWKHAYIPDVAAELGCGPRQGCPSQRGYPDDTFDEVWEVKFVYQPEEPIDEVMDLFISNSPLLRDDYGWLEKANADVDESTDPSNTEMDVGSNNGDKVSQGAKWTVYGSITNQWFDPLAATQRRKENERTGTGTETEAETEDDL